MKMVYDETQRKAPQHTTCWGASNNRGYGVGVGVRER